MGSIYNLIYRIYYFFFKRLGSGDPGGTNVGPPLITWLSFAWPAMWNFFFFLVWQRLPQWLDRTSQPKPIMSPNPLPYAKPNPHTKRTTPCLTLAWDEIAGVKPKPPSQPTPHAPRPHSLMSRVHC
ncbi:hypothetical protein HanRHA438_Chr05g0221931 [Helianthus annuus]|nr:hypothetical protein HanRHA438_Chr05g0221931 [Helianthus annuus]